MLIFLYGSDTYRSRRKLNEIIDNYGKVHKGGLNLKFFEEENLNFQEFKNELETASIFKEKKLLVLKDVFSNQSFKNEFLQYKEKLIGSDDIILVYISKEKEISKSDPLYKFLKKNSASKVPAEKKEKGLPSLLSQEFKPLKGEELKDWAKKEIENYGARIEKEALSILVESVGDNLWQMENEIKKLTNFKNKKTIGKEDVDLLVRQKIETDIFKTIDALAERKKNLALSLIHKHLEKGDSPLYLLTMINFEFRNLLEIKDFMEKNTPYYKILKQSNLHPFVVRKSFQLAQRFTFGQLKKIYQKIFQADINIKTGKIDPETALDLLVAEI